MPLFISFPIVTRIILSKNCGETIIVAIFAAERARTAHSRPDGGRRNHEEVGNLQLCPQRRPS